MVHGVEHKFKNNGDALEFLFEHTEKCEICNLSLNMGVYIK